MGKGTSVAIGTAVALALFARVSAAQDAGAIAADAPDAGGLSAEVSAPAPAVEPSDAAPPQAIDVADLDLESLLAQPITSSTKTQQRAAQAPAVITVVTADEIQARGYTTLADVLRAVPGFYDVYDFVTHNVGVRGINGGANASGNVIKVMIDYQPVDYSPSTGNFFGEELIPLELIERIEIIRGPASALYGANAFLGVVNLITKAPSDLHGARVIANANTHAAHVGGGGGGILGGEAGPVAVLVGVHGSYTDRSGLPLGSTSPSLNAALSPLSKNDAARPFSLFGKASVKDVGGGKLTLSGSLQQLDSGGELLPFGPMSHGTRIAATNTNVWLNYDVSFSERASLKLRADYFHAAPGAQERIDVGRSDSTLVRSVGADGAGVSAEGRFTPKSWLTLIAGGDYVREDHLLQTFGSLLTQDVRAADGTLLRSAGTLIHGEGYGTHKVFHSGGAFGQGLLTLGDDFSAVAGVRLDLHSIYGLNPSFRAGLVYAPASRPLSLKLLYGSSFKAPSAEQLYTQPSAGGDLLGNPLLKPQTAHTLELVGGWGFSANGELLVNVFVTDVIGRVEFIQNGLYLQAQNQAPEWVVGGELDARFRITRTLNLKLAAGIARTVARSEASLIFGAPEPTNALFPLVQLHALGDYTLPLWGLKLGAELSFVSGRSASQSNALLAGDAYETPSSLYTAVSLALPPRRIFGARETSVSLRVSNPINLQWSEPGFGGVDVPSQPIRAVLNLVQQL